MIGINVVKFSQGIDESRYGEPFAGSTIRFEDGRDTTGVTRPDRCVDQSSSRLVTLTFAPVATGIGRRSKC